MHTVRLVPRHTATTAATALPLVVRALPATVAVGTAEGGAHGPQCVKRWQAAGGLVPARLRQQQQQRLQVQCFYRTSGDDAPASAEQLPAPARNSPSDAPPPLLAAHANSPAQRDVDVTRRCMSTSSTSKGATGKTDDGDSTTRGPAGSHSESPAVAQEGTVTACGRRRRHLRSPSSTPVTSTSPCRSLSGRGLNAEQQKSTCAVTGRLRGRAARTCLRATAAWLGALLPQGASTATPAGDSAAAAMAILARVSRRGGAAIPAAAAAAAKAQREASAQQPPPLRKAAEGNEAEMPPSVAPADTADAAAAAADPAKAAADAATATANAAAAEAASKDAQAGPLAKAGRRRRQGNPRGPLGTPGAPDLSFGGAMNFQFPVLFNVVIKRLLKPLLRRGGQPRRRPCSRVAAAPTPTTAAAAAAAGARSGQRPPLPPRVLLRSWRPLSGAQSFRGPQSGARIQQQQHVQPQAAMQQQAQQEAVPSQELPRGAPATLQQQQQEQAGGAVPAAERATPHEQDQQPKPQPPGETAPLPDASVPAESEAAVATEKELEGAESEAGSQEEGGPAYAAPLVAHAAPAAVQQQEQQQQTQQKRQQQQQGASVKPAAVVLPAPPTRGAVGRGAARAPPPPRSPLPVRFIHLRIAAVYGQLRSLMSPYVGPISEWMYNNGNVIVTVGSLLSLTATLMADMRMLRFFNLLAGFCFCTYNWTRRPRLTDAALWNVVFLVLNCVMLWRVQTEHREVAFSSHELDVFQRYFLPAGMSPRQFRRLLKQGKWRTLPQGYVLQREGSACEALCFVVRGTVEISQGGETIETYRGGETGAVVGVEPFLSYVAALRKHAAKRGATPAAATPPETLASHADESPDAMHQHEQKGQPSKGGGPVAETPNVQQQQQLETEIAGRKTGASCNGNTKGAAEGAQPDTAALPTPSPDAAEQQQKQQQHKPLLPVLSAAEEGPAARAASAGADTAAALRDDIPEGPPSPSPGTSIVAAAAEAAANAAAAVRTAAATALSAEGARTPGQQQANDVPTKSSALAADLGDKGAPAATMGQQRTDVRAPAGTAASATASSGAAAEATETNQKAGPAGEQQQQLQRRSPAPKGGDSEGLEGRPEEEAVTAPLTATCTTEATVFSLDVKEFAAFVLREPENLGFPVVQGLTTLLINRSRAQAAKIALHSYDAVLAGVFADGVVQTDERKLLEEFRRKRAISQAQHEQALARLGWTLEEFERGSQSGTGMLSRIAVGLGSLIRGPQSSESDRDVQRLYQQQDEIALQGIRSAGVPPRTLQSLFEDWELVEDARAVPLHPATEANQHSSHPAESVETTPSSGSSADAVSYAFEEEAVPFG